MPLLVPLRMITQGIRSISGLYMIKTPLNMTDVLCIDYLIIRLGRSIMI